ncbi:hypothetical protein J2X55_000853 [Microbacterium sp. 1154]|uniref:hypothetical protein n=1 Tax=Microbacterium sp. 1154 TaxID=2817733 RepID=UPI002861C055|nr:hypothetical protein [Microbacterium sp. 1154]MDR6689954.1 hypothetical protein [Microbacterium sp. 1154]
MILVSNFIRLDGDLASFNISLLTQGPEEIPNTQQIVVVDGNSTEEAATAFTDHLKQRAEELASEVDKVRMLVAKHAEDLRSAVEALQETDSINSTQADQARAIIDAASEAPSPGSATNGTSGGAAGVRAALGIPQ